MTVNLNQIKKGYKGMLANIPADKLKELYYNLYLDIWKAMYIEQDQTAYENCLKVLETLNNETKPADRFNAVRDALINAPHEIIKEILLDKRELGRLYFMCLTLNPVLDLALYNALSESLENGFIDDAQEVLNILRDNRKYSFLGDSKIIAEMEDTCKVLEKKLEGENVEYREFKEFYIERVKEFLTTHDIKKYRKKI
jgi:hypothetical protein